MNECRNEEEMKEWRKEKQPPTTTEGGQAGERTSTATNIPVSPI